MHFLYAGQRPRRWTRFFSKADTSSTDLDPVMLGPA
jgi:hypothetical protein